MKRFLLPLLAFATLAVVLALALRREPQAMPSALLDRPAPGFSLARLDDPTRRLGPEAMRGQVWLLNVWASWCAACRDEHGELLRLATGGVDIVGLAYKDMPAAAQGWLQQHGDPYLVALRDDAGRAGIDYGVYGVPETFVIDKQGRIRHRQVGPLTRAAVEGTLLPLLERLRRE